MNKEPLFLRSLEEIKLDHGTSIKEVSYSFSRKYCGYSQFRLPIRWNSVAIYPPKDK